MKTVNNYNSIKAIRFNDGTIYFKWDKKVSKAGRTVFNYNDTYTHMEEKSVVYTIYKSIYTHTIITGWDDFGPTKEEDFKSKGNEGENKSMIVGCDIGELEGYRKGYITQQDQKNRKTGEVRTQEFVHPSSIVNISQREFFDALESATETESEWENI